MIFKKETRCPDYDIGDALFILRKAEDLLNKEEKMKIDEGIFKLAVCVDENGVMMHKFSIATSDGEFVKTVWFSE